MRFFNRVILAVGAASIIFAAAAAPYHAWAEGKGRPLTEREARYLLTRAGFAPSEAEIKAIMAQPSREAAVDSLLNGANSEAFALPQPAWVAMPWGAYQAWLNPVMASAKNGEEKVKQSAIKLKADGVARQDLRNWWALQLAQTPSPLSERMVLFWHNLFPVTDGNEWEFHQTDIKIRANALGSYAQLLTAMSHDVGVLRYLGQNKSTAKYPTANLAREMMELFSIGIGNYTERDVIEVSRAQTGLTIDPRSWMFAYDPKVHDEGLKTILGQTGNWGPDDVISILLRQKSLAPRIVSKLWLEFVSATPDKAAVERIAASFRKDWRIKPVLRQLFLSDAFWSPASRGTLVKSPAEFVIGAVRGDLGMANRSHTLIKGTDLTAMIWGDGEVWWMPPNVRGFLTGTNWINTHTLLARQQTAGQLASLWATEVLSKRYKTLPIITPAQYISWATAVMGDLPILAPPAQNVTIVAAAKQILSDPAYWLK